MIDPMVSLAFSLYSNRGVHALLLGSGISRASGIPTGWEVVLDLIRKVAKAEQEDCEPDPAVWFEKKHGSTADYSKLLDSIAKTSAERQQLLRAYFEPTGDERTQGLKTPSAAHKAIAKLVVAGHLRVIITTNFDKLTERALEEEAGIAPTVISTVDQIQGALPLAHSGVTVIKLHGDYLDTRIKNTETELATYDASMNVLLDRIFDEYGLIVCGWSADWDTALRAAIERCPSRRFTTYWATRGQLSTLAKQLIDRRKAEVIPIGGADEFFTGLWEKVRALDDISAPHPLSAKIAVATVKRCVVDPMSKIRLHDLVYNETERLFNELNGGNFPASESHATAEEELRWRLSEYEILSEQLLSIFVAGCYWGTQQHSQLWIHVLERIAKPEKPNDGLTHLLNLRKYPALLLLYGGGLAAVAAGNIETLAALFRRPKIRVNGDDQVFLFYLNIYETMESVEHMLPGVVKNHKTPISEYLYKTLRDTLREYLPQDEQYQVAFDRFEYMLALVYVDAQNFNDDDTYVRGPIGCFGRRRHPSIQKIIHDEIDANWPPLKAGLFGGDVGRAKRAKAKFDIFVTKAMPGY